MDTLKLLQAFERVRERAQKSVAGLYTVHCLKCAQPLVADCFVREGDNLVEVRYKGCPHCEHRCEGGCKLRKQDVDAVAELESRRIKEWYPKLVKMLPSDGFEAPKKLSIRFVANKQGVADTGGTRGDPRRQRGHSSQG